MTWASATRKHKQHPVAHAVRSFCRPFIPQHTPDWTRLVSLDFETFWDADYTLSKLSTSEYVRDPRFKAQMCGIKVGNGKTRVIPAARIKTELKKINWSTHSLLCHNTQFDAFILSHHYDIHPVFLYDSLAMARGLHSNDIGAGLDEVSIFYGGQGKLEGLEATKGVLNWPKPLYDNVATYCANDVDEMLRVFKLMLPKMPADEIELIDLTCRMFCSPVLKVDIPRVEKELKRELDERERKFYESVDPADYDVGGAKYDPVEYKTILKTKAERALEGKEREMLIIKRVIGSNEKYAELLKAEGIDPPMKISPAWMKLDKDDRESPEGQAKKYSYAFAKDDLKFTELPNMIDEWGLDLNKPSDVALMTAKQARLQSLVDVRLAVKSTTNITRAQRFLTAGANGMSLPVGLHYYGAHTGRWSGGNKMNCLPGESEILTPAGWVKLAKYDGLAPAAVWDAGTKQIAFAPVKRVAISYSGPMIRAKTCTGTHDALYTPDHGLPVVTYRDKLAVSRRTASSMVDATDWLLPVSGKYVNELPSFGITPAMARFAAAMQADGGIAPNSVDSSAAQFGFTKERKITRFRELCADAGLKYTETTVGEYTKFYVNHGQAPLAMFKYFNSWMLGLSGESLAALVDEAAYWDGHKRGDSYLYSTAIKSNAEWLQTAAHLSGRSAQIQEVDNFRGWNKNPDAKLWVVNVKPREYVVNEKNRGVLKVEPGFDGMVYCLTTPTGWFMMRYNGTIHVTGNCQNLVRGGELRLSIMAPKGHMLCVADSGQIEARVGAWLWGQDDVVAAFRDADRGVGRDAYCNFADFVYGRTITKADKMERFVGKVCVLALSFGMGALKFQMTLAKGALGGPPVHFSLDRCKEIVNTYRLKNYKIAQGWKICAQIIEDMAAGRQGSYGPLNWEANTIWLPNGMALKYPDLKKSMGDKGWEEWTYQSGDMRKKIYGGLLAENLAQSLARIIVGWQMLPVSRKYRVVMMTHDEFVTMPKASQAAVCFKLMTKWMQTAPPWCSDLPLASEGGFDVNYSK